MTPTQAEARRRVEEAQILIESAQISIEMASNGIFSVHGVGPELNQLGRVYREIKTTWESLEAKLEGVPLELDPLFAKRFIERKPGWFVRDILARKAASAAAPDLLETLKQVDDLVDGMEDITDEGAPNLAMRIQTTIRPAIAKAGSRS